MEAGARWPSQRRGSLTPPSYRPEGPQASTAAWPPQPPSTPSAWPPRHRPDSPARNLSRESLLCCSTPPAPCCRPSVLSPVRKSEWARPPSPLASAGPAAARTVIPKLFHGRVLPEVPRPRNPPERLSVFPGPAAPCRRPQIHPTRADAPPCVLAPQGRAAEDNTPPPADAPATAWKGRPSNAYLPRGRDRLQPHSPAKAGE